MNQSFIAPTSLRPDAIALVGRLRRGLLLSGATGMALSLGATPLWAQSLAGKTAPASNPATASKAARAALNQAKIQEAAGSVGLAAVQYREALAQAPRDASFARELARFYTRQNRAEEATIEWKRVLILKGHDAEATRELARLARLIPVVATGAGTGVADVAPLPPVEMPRTQTRVLASKIVKVSLPAKDRILLAQTETGAGTLGPLPDTPLPDAPLPLPSTSTQAAPPTTEVAPTTTEAAPTAPEVGPPLGDSAPPATQATPPATASAPPATQATPPALPPASMPMAPVADSVPRTRPAALPPSTHVSPIPFSLPASRAVSVSKKTQAAAYPFVNRGAQYLNAKRYQRALLEYQRAAALDPANPYALPGVATSQIILGRFDDAAATYRQFLAIAPRKVDSSLRGTTSVSGALRGLADALTYGKRYREALGVNAFLLSRDPHDFAAAYQNGQVYTFLHSYAGADAAFQRALSIRHEDPGALTAWGESLSYRRDPRTPGVLLRALAVQPGNPRSTLALGNYYLYTGQFNDAIPRFRTVLQSEPTNVPVLVSLGDSLAFSAHPTAAIAPYKRALQLQPGNAKASLGLGRALVYSGRFSEGARVLSPIVTANPNNVEALEALALAQSSTQSPNAARSLTRLLQLQNEPTARARTLAALGDLRLEAKDIPGATQYYAQAVPLAPRDAKLNATYAQLLSYNKQWQEAEAAAARALALDPKNPQAQTVQLQSALQLGDQATSTRLIGQLENFKPANFEDSLSLSLALRSAGLGVKDDSGNFTIQSNPALLTAADRLLALAASQVKTPKAKLRLADATRDAGDYPNAIRFYKRVIELDPNNVAAHSGLVQTLFWSGDFQQATAESNALLAIAPNDPRSQLLAARIQMRVGTPEARDNAARFANSILSRDLPVNADYTTTDILLIQSDARTILGQALTSRKRYAEAVRQLQEAVDKNPNNLGARLGLARNLNYARDTEGSIQQYRELIGLAPADAVPRLELAQILLDLSRYPEADALYNEVLVLRRSAWLLPSVRRAIASNSLRHLTPEALLDSPLVRVNALIVPRRTSKKRVVVDNPMLASTGKRRLFAQNPELPTSPADPGAGVLPQASTTTPGVNTIPSTPLGGTEGGPEVAPPLQNGPTTPTPDTTGPDTTATVPTPPEAGTAPTDTTLATGGTTPTDTTPATGGTTELGTTPFGPETDTVPLTPLQEKGEALRGLGESQRRQNNFAEAINYFQQALALQETDLPARVGLAQSLRAQGQFAEALTQVQSVLGIESQYFPARVLEAQLLADTGKTAESQAKLDELVSQVVNPPTNAISPAETFTQTALGLNAVGSYTKSLDLLGRAITLYPTEPSLERLRAQTLGLSGQTDAAVAAYDALLTTDPHDSEALLGKARVLNYANRLAESETVYRQVLQTQSDNPQLQSELADVLGRRGNYTEAVALYQSASQANPKNTDLLLSKARLLRAAGQPADAEAALNQVLDTQPDNVNALVERGLVRGTSGNYAPGIADLNRALTLQPTNASAQLGLAQVQSYAGQYADSIASYQTYLTSHPENVQARVELAQTLSYAGQSNDALKVVDEVLSSQPDNSDALLVRADILARTNQPDEAVKIYEALLARDPQIPQSARARTGLADAFLYARRYPEAISAYDKILASDPNNSTARISRARALSYAGRAREAVSALRDIVSTDPTNVTARLALAEVGANSGNATLQRDAISEYRAVLKDSPENINAQIGLARVLSYRGNYAEAQSLLNTVLKANPGNTDARVALADAQRFAGRPFDAQQNYRLVTGTAGASADVLASARTGLSSLHRLTSPSIGVSGSYYDDTNGIRLRSVGESAILRTRALTIGVLADQGRFHQNNLAERNRTNIGILLARQFGPFAAQLIVSRLKYSGVNAKTLYSLSLNRDFSPRKRLNLSVSRRDIFESDLAVGSGITADIYNASGTLPLGRRFDLDLAGTYYRYSDSNSRVTLAPALMFRLKPTNPSLRIGLGYIYDNTDQPRNAPFVYYTPQDFNAAAILADYIVTTGKTRYGISGAVPITGSTGAGGINRPADTLFGFLERDLGNNLDFNIRGGIVRVPNSNFRSNQISGGFNLNF